MTHQCVVASPGLSRRSLLGRGGLIAAVVGLGGPRRATSRETTPTGIRWERDVVYGEVAGQSLLMDIASPPPGTGHRAAVIAIHGGAFRSFFDDHVALLAGAGYVAINLGYRHFSEENGTNAWPAPLDDAQRAVRWVRANAAALGIDPARVGALGHGSGASLAAHLGTRETRADNVADLAGTSSRVRCVVDVAGWTDMMIPLPELPANPVTTAILGGTADAPPGPAALRDYSPVAHVDAETVPFLILHGTHDSSCPIGQARRMTAALQGYGREVVAAEFPLLDHLSILDWKAIGPETLAFLGRHLRPEG